jgi:uncharacterized protein (DUF1501 family)
MQRRQFLGLGAAVSASLLLGAHALARPASATRRFVWINLRGAMDALHAVLPTFDKELGKHRATLLGAVESGLLPLSGGFALHPELKTLHAWFREKSFSPVVAVASPYRERSHFAAQDVLESGLSPADAESGWLARAPRCVAAAAARQAGRWQAPQQRCHRRWPRRLTAPRCRRRAAGAALVTGCCFSAAGARTAQPNRDAPSLWRRGA